MDKRFSESEVDILRLAEVETHLWPGALWPGHQLWFSGPGSGLEDAQVGMLLKVCMAGWGQEREETAEG